MIHSPLTNFRHLPLAIFCGFSAHAADLHVSPTGDDRNPGTQAAPFQYLASARDVARRFAGKESVTIHIADGVYYLPETLLFTPADSGSEKFPVIYQAANEGKAVLSGGLKLDLKWEAMADGIFKKPLLPRAWLGLA